MRVKMGVNKKILMLPGDGIGPGVMEEVRRVIGWMQDKNLITLEIQEKLIGGSCIDKLGIPIEENTIQFAREADGVLLGAVGGPKWDNVDFNIRPEPALLKIRKHLGLFANLRPARVFAA